MIMRPLDRHLRTGQQAAQAAPEPTTRAGGVPRRRVTVQLRGVI